MFQAVSYQKKAVIVCERIFGVDHPDTIIAYVSSSYHEGPTLSPHSYIPGYFWKRGFFKSVLAFFFVLQKSVVEEAQSPMCSLKWFFSFAC